MPAAGGVKRDHTALIGGCHVLIGLRQVGISFNSYRFCFDGAGATEGRVGACPGAIYLRCFNRYVFLIRNRLHFDRRQVEGPGGVHRQQGVRPAMYVLIHNIT